MKTLWLCLLLLLPALAAPYDPLALQPGRVQFQDLTVPGKREVPVRVYLPADPTRAPVVLFSHGLGGSRAGCAYLGEHWAGRGYVAVFLQHPGSDTEVWKDVPPAQRMQALREAASGQNLQLRMEDVGAVLDWLPRSPLANRLDMRRVGMSGHSFGAVTTQHVSGQTGGPADPRLRAAVAFSPSSPRVGDPGRAFGQVKIPWMLMTGTEDVAPIGDQDVASRLAVFPALPPGDKYQLVLFGGHHSDFGERGDGNRHRTILALTTAFWDAYLRRDGAARAWLQGNGVRSVLGPQDRWEKK